MRYEVREQKYCLDTGIPLPFQYMHNGENMELILRMKKTAVYPEIAKTPLTNISASVILYIRYIGRRYNGSRKRYVWQIRH